MVLAYILAPWPHTLRTAVPTADAWCYVDDRSIKIRSNPDHEQHLKRALEVTNKFDDDVGLVQNHKKRQLWGANHNASVEHLGITAAPLHPNQLLQPRNGWEKATQRLTTLQHLPTSFDVRFRCILAYIRPLFTWAAPLHARPPPAITQQAFNAVTRRCSNWWCKRRFWADHLAIHPEFSSSALALKAMGPYQYDSQHLRNAYEHHLRFFQLSFHLFSDDHGTAAKLPANADADLRASVQHHNDRLPEDQRLFPQCFWTASSHGQHVLRHLYRRSLLSTIPRSRLDSEGCESIDMTAQSHSNWTKWRKSLTGLDRFYLRVFRAGAIRTPTRLHNTQNQPTCPHCDCQLASARHFFAECPRFEPKRLRLQLQHQLPPTWFCRQPRVTSKSGWITTMADSDPARRATLQVVACQLGISIVQLNGASAA